MVYHKNKLKKDLKTIKYSDPIKDKETHSFGLKVFLAVIVMMKFLFLKI